MALPKETAELKDRLRENLFQIAPLIPVVSGELTNVEGLEALRKVQTSLREMNCIATELHNRAVGIRPGKVG